MDNKERRELARELASLADRAVAIVDHEPGSAQGDFLDGTIHDMYRQMSRGNYAAASKLAIEILSNVGLTVS
jgi:hypothetical protein